MLEHIEKVEKEVVKLYNHILGQPDVVKLYFDCTVSSLDPNTLWATFEGIAYAEIFRYTKGNIEALNTTSTQIYNSVLSVWPSRYYLAKLQDAGAIIKFDMGKGKMPVWAIRESYSELLKTILIPDATS